MTEKKIVVYEHADFQGRSKMLIPGKYKIIDLYTGFLNDRISSLKVPEDMKVTLYEHSNFSGRKKTFLEDNAYVGDDFNDKTSSILVELVVAIYEHSDYQGRSQKLSPGKYNIGDLVIGNDTVSSLKVPEGLKVTLYEHADFSGRTKTFMENSTYVGDDFNDKTSSILVELVATIYEHSNYQGRSKKLGPGRYDMDDLGIGNDTVSSLKVPYGLKVTLYEHANFTGRTKTFMENSTYVGDDFNDITSSIKVDVVP